MRQPWRTLLLVATVLLSLLFVKACPVDAADGSMTLGLWTQHYKGDHTEGFNNHPIVVEVNGWTGSFFKNSYGKETGFIGYSWHTPKWNLPRSDEWYVQGTLAAGVLSGYGEKHPLHWRALSPGVYPQLNLGRGRHSVGLGVMPSFTWLSYRLEF